jgi:hypothetical protein
MVLVPSEVNEGHSVGSHSALLGVNLLLGPDVLDQLLHGNGLVEDVGVILALDSHLVDQSVSIGRHARNHDINVLVDFEDFVSSGWLD